MSDDISDEELERRMTAKLFGGKTGSVKVEIRKGRGRPRPVVEVEAKPIPLSEGGDDAFVFVFTSVTPDGKRIKLKSVRGDASNDPKAIIREYEREGRLVRWVGKRPEDFLED